MYELNQVKELESLNYLQKRERERERESEMHSRGRKSNKTLSLFIKAKYTLHKRRALGHNTPPEYCMPVHNYAFT